MISQSDQPELRGPSALLHRPPGDSTKGEWNSTKQAAGKVLTSLKAPHPHQELLCAVPSSGPGLTHPH